MKRQIISNVDELEVLGKQVTASAVKAAETLSKLLNSQSPLSVLRKAKFEAIGVDPLSDRPLNLIEQINQTFTYLASFEATRHLLRLHPEHSPFCLNLGTAGGSDISSKDGAVAAEVFAAVGPHSNKKLKKDVEKVANARARHRYVFYSCAGVKPGKVDSLSSHPDVQIISLGVCGPEGGGG